MFTFFNTSFVKKVVVYILAVFEGFLALRVFLKVFSVNSDTGFVSWIYQITQPYVNPFMGMFSSSIPGISVNIEFSTLFGMLMYAFLGYAIIYLIDMFDPQ